MNRTVWYSDRYYLWMFILPGQEEVPTEQCGYPSEQDAWKAYENFLIS